ncbi:MAG: hypothetical protein ABSH41_14680 [Syntrophobacteraceae bacterium]
MYYYFDKSTPHWKERKRRKLTRRFEELVERLPLDAEGHRAYVEERPGYVAIRRITHYTPAQIDEVVDAAKVIYKVVMKVPLEGREEEDGEEQKA